MSTIRGKFLLLFCALGALPMLAVGIASYFNSIGTVEEVIAQRAVSSADKIAADIHTFFIPRQSEADFLSWNQEIIDLYTRRTTDGPQAAIALEPQLDAFFRQVFTGPRTVFAQLYYLDLHGELICKYSRSTSTGLNNTGTNSDIALGSYIFSWDDPDFPNYKPPANNDIPPLSINTATGPVLRLTRWVTDADENRRGLLLADLSVADLLAQIPSLIRLADHEYLVLVDRAQDTILYHPLTTFAGQDINRVLPALAPVYAQAKNQANGSAPFTIDGEKHLVAHVTDAELDWYIGIVTRPTRFTGPVERAGLFNLVVTFASVLLVLILVPLVVGRITRSIATVTQGAEAIAAGDLDQQITVATRDETSALADAFNRMAQSLKKTLGDLRALSTELEERVERRTTELADANTRLADQNRDLNTERALGEVRGAVMSMQHAADIEQVAQLMRDELNAMGVSCDQAGINIADEEHNTFRSQWSSVLIQEQRPTPPSKATTPQSAPPTDNIARLLDYWRRGAVWSRQRGDEGYATDPQVWVVDVPFTYGTLAMNRGRHDATAGEFTAGEIDLLRRFADVISLAYNRYLDFQRLEAQNQALAKANEQIEQASRHKSQFLSQMSHDLRTPMNAIIGYTRILLRRSKQALDQRQYHNLENIQTSAQTLLKLINEILDLSRIEAGRVEVQPAEMDLAALANECATAVESLVPAAVELKRELAPVPLLTTDPDLLRRVITNVLGNAVKFTDTGSITLSVRADNGNLTLIVADTGPGIPAKDLPYIFEEFRRVEGQRQEGSGLGLAIVKKTVDLLGGSIEVESEVGRGTTFTLSIGDY